MAGVPGSIAAMRIALLLAAVLVAAVPAAGEAKKRPMPTYAYAIRCAGLTGAWMRAAPDQSAERITRFDKALYWGLAAADMGKRAGHSAARVEADGQAELARAETALAGAGADAAGAAAARGALDKCVAEVPPLKGRKPAKRPRRGERG